MSYWSSNEFSVDKSGTDGSISDISQVDPGGPVQLSAVDVPELDRAIRSGERHAACLAGGHGRDGAVAVVDGPAGYELTRPRGAGCQGQDLGALRRHLGEAGEVGLAGLGDGVGWGRLGTRSVGGGAAGEQAG